MNINPLLMLTMVFLVMSCGLRSLSSLTSNNSSMHDSCMRGAYRFCLVFGWGLCFGGAASIARHKGRKSLTSTVPCHPKPCNQKLQACSSFPGCILLPKPWLLRPLFPAPLNFLLSPHKPRTIGAYIITNTILGVPYSYYYCIMGPKPSSNYQALYYGTLIDPL